MMAPFPALGLARLGAPAPCYLCAQRKAEVDTHESGAPVCGACVWLIYERPTDGR